MGLRGLDVHSLWSGVPWLVPSIIGDRFSYTGLMSLSRTGLVAPLNSLLELTQTCTPLLKVPCSGVVKTLGMLELAT